MQVSEIFFGIQGEGINLGLPAIFLRLSGCNLRCSFCDTTYSQDPLSGKKMAIPQIIKHIKKYPSKHLVITGGEPLLQQEELLKLLPKLKNYFIEVETNGTISPLINKYVNQYNCSPKLKNSGQTSILKKFPKTKTYYKFVVDKKSDIKEIKAFIKKHKIDKENVILMPQGTKKSEIEKRSKWLIEICKKENFRFTTRLHIILFNGKRKT